VRDNLGLSDLYPLGYEEMGERREFWGVKFCKSWQYTPKVAIGMGHREGRYQNGHPERMQIIQPGVARNELP
jgi:hypothetical protein